MFFHQKRKVGVTKELGSKSFNGAWEPIWYGWSNVAKSNETILCVQQKNYFDSTNFSIFNKIIVLIQPIIFIFNEIIILIQRIIYTFSKIIIIIQRIIYIFNEIIILIQQIIHIFNERIIFIQRIIYIFNERIVFIQQFFLCVQRRWTNIFLRAQRFRNFLCVLQNPRITNLVLKFSTWFLGSSRKFFHKNILLRRPKTLLRMAFIIWNSNRTNFLKIDFVSSYT